MPRFEDVPLFDQPRPVGEVAKLLRTTAMNDRWVVIRDEDKLLRISRAHTEYSSGFIKPVQQRYLVIDLIPSERGVTVKHVESKWMDYRQNADGSEVIRKTYRSWVEDFLGAARRYAKKAK